MYTQLMHKNHWFSIYPERSFYRKPKNYMFQDLYPCSQTRFREEKWAAETSGGKNMGADENDDNITSSTEDKYAHIEVVVEWSTGYGTIIW